MKNIHEATKANGGCGRAKDFTPAGTPEPTRVMPGSREKLQLLIARAEAGEELWHEDDLNFTDDQVSNTDIRNYNEGRGPVGHVETEVLRIERNGHGPIVSGD